jgi:GAF domain-containing protein
MKRGDFFEKVQEPRVPDPRVLGQILSAQSLLFSLPTTRKIAEFFASSLSSVPGVNSCRVCLGDVHFKEGEGNGDPCAECMGGRIEAGKTGTIPRDFSCSLASHPNISVVTIETTNFRFGFFAMGIGRIDLFELYRPFLSNLGNYVALSLENRLQGAEIRKARDSLEKRVAERTEELRAAAEKLEGEIEERNRAEETLRLLNRHLEVIGACMEAIMREDDEPTLLVRVCGILREIAGYRLAAIGVPDGAGPEILRPLAWAGAEGADPGATGSNLKLAALLGEGPARFALHEGRAGFEQGAGTQSRAGLPLRDERGRIFGVLALEAAGDGPFTVEEIALLDELAERVGFGVGALRARRERNKAERQLVDYQEHLEELVQERSEALKAANAELEGKNSELERMNRIFVGRELRMMELKARIKELETRS